MIRRNRPWLAPLALALTLTLPTPPALAQFSNTRRPEEKEVKEDSGYIWGYLLAAALASAIAFTVCKPGHRELNTPKAGAAGPGVRH